MQVNPDTKVEANETFSVSLGALSEIGATAAAAIQLAGSPLLGTILNDDQAVLTLTGPPATEEGTGGAPTAFVFQVTLSSAVQGGLQLAYLTGDGTATVADNDYVDNDAQLTFNGTAGEIAFHHRSCQSRREAGIRRKRFKCRWERSRVCRASRRAI